jgi:hypothetical protein
VDQGFRRKINGIVKKSSFEKTIEQTTSKVISWVQKTQQNLGEMLQNYQPLNVASSDRLWGPYGRGSY